MIDFDEIQRVVKRVSAACDVVMGTGYTVQSNHPRTAIILTTRTSVRELQRIGAALDTTDLRIDTNPSDGRVRIEIYLEK